MTAQYLPKIQLYSTTRHTSHVRGLEL